MQKQFLTLLFMLSGAVASGQGVGSFNHDWEFVRDVDSVFVGKLLDKNIDIAWQKVSLPHTATLEPVNKTGQHWQGTCYYRKFFNLPLNAKGKHVAIQFDAAMQVADIFLNGKKVFHHVGGYLPFYIDVSEHVLFGSQNSVVVKLSNEDTPLVPPGKPLKDLDFNYYSGLYRNAWLIVKERLYISNPIAANRVAAGGVLVHYDNVNASSASLLVQVDVQNDFASTRQAETRIILFDKTGKEILRHTSPGQSVAPASFATFRHQTNVAAPHLWTADDPYLYQLRVEIVENGKVIDGESIKTGIRTVRVTEDGLFLNDQKVVIRGTNRHQDYPFIGNAVSDNAQYRDAYKIKLAGFNFVRSSHYPQSPAFLDACDELGLMVMDAIPGWQYVGDDVFQENSFQDIRDMIRRDRNHPSIVLWEASLNESTMRKGYMQKAHDIVHAELPFSGTYSAGWVNQVYDVFLPARQHAKAPDYWKKHNDARPLLIAEYGDWEYYAQNAGFNQTQFKDLKEEERTSRQLRGFGEKRLLQQALNYQEAHNDNLYNVGLGDANWLMYDYNRGYADDIESSGIMDIMRLPKFAFYFYQSQARASTLNTVFHKPMIYIASYWQPSSSTAVRIFSNCDEVELFLNGKSVGKRGPDKNDYTVNLKHPPFTFQLPAFMPGILHAVGYIGKKRVVEEKRRTPGKAVGIKLRLDESGRPLVVGSNDAVFVYAEIVDANGTLVPEYNGQIEFSVTGDAEIIFMNKVFAEAGIATILLKAGMHPGKIDVRATGGNLTSSAITIEALK
jgi:beta-galactosidase